ncbi:TerB family tellurite resistance protein [Sansalvadorimonas verongulae]|uniref:TerB family tellurite resistance protein n=1 Tax=Sansalvadorimonas verongulae TaxID=2172824 RepID=UPI0018AD2CC9|nr:TerB family tellurite resistance protein [Sansalvadorimonas verongulae]
MFIQNLNAKQQFLLVEMAETIITSDGKISENEQVVLNTILAQVSEEAKVLTDVRISDVGRIFDTQTAKSSLLLELLGIALADDEFHDNEEEYLLDVARKISVSAEHLTELKDWVVGLMKHMKKLEPLMGDQ